MLTMAVHTWTFDLFFSGFNAKEVHSSAVCACASIPTSWDCVCCCTVGCWEFCPPFFATSFSFALAKLVLFTSQEFPSALLMIAVCFRRSSAFGWWDSRQHQHCNQHSFIAVVVLKEAFTDAGDSVCSLYYIFFCASLTSLRRRRLGRRPCAN